jgi:hypothetical protein
MHEFAMTPDASEQLAPPCGQDPFASRLDQADSIWC